MADADHPALADLLVFGPAGAAAAVTIEAVGKPRIASSGRKPALTYPAPVASADVVLGSAGTDRGRRLAELVTPRLFEDVGWQPPGTQPTGLPPADLLDALRSAWREAAG